MADLMELAARLTPPMQKVLAQVKGPTFWTTDPMLWEEAGLARMTDMLPEHEGPRTFYRYRLNRAGLALRARAEKGG